MSTLMKLLLLLFAAGAAAFAFWLRRSRDARQDFRGKPPRAARVAEALALVIIGAVILTIGGTDSNNNGMLLRLDQLPQTLASAQVALAAVTGFLILGGAALAWKGMTRLGIVLVAVALSAFGLMINGPGRPINSFASVEEPVTVDFTLGVSGVNIPHGVRLWVNGVHLGEAPIQMPLDEFLDKVPAVTDKDEAVELWVNDYGLQRGNSLFNRLIEFSVSAPNDYPRAAELAPTYYARVEYAGEQGIGTGQNGSGSGGSGHHFQSRADIEVIFPARTRRLQSLVNQARLQDYHVGPEWFEALETYDADGWLKLRQLAQSNEALDLRNRTRIDGWRPPEREFLNVLQAWAAWRYDLDKVRDDASAWAAFERIMAQADADGIYLTPSAAGAAVEWLAPQLPPARLVERALESLEEYRNYSYIQWQAFDAPQFGVVARAGGATVQPENAMHSYGGQGVGGKQFPPRAAALAHALWVQDRQLGASANGDSPIELEVAPALLRRAYRAPGQPYLAAATEIGGPVVEQYLLRHDWQSGATRGDYREIYHLHGTSLNKWLYFLSQLDSPRARHARQNRPDVFLNLAQEITKSIAFSGSVENLDFLFQDPPTGERSLALMFWPQFRDLVLNNAHEPATQLFEYLVRVEPLSTVEMYAEAWRRSLEKASRPYMVSYHFLPLQDLPEQKRRAVFDALLQVSDDYAGTDEIERWTRQGMFPVEYTTEQALDRLQNGDEEGREQIRGWLAHGNPAHPVVTVLATAPEPDLRALSLAAIGACPKPEHRALLGALLQDSDPAVRAEAEATCAALDRLAATPPMTFASGATTFADVAAAVYLSGD